MSHRKGVGAKTDILAAICLNPVLGKLKQKPPTFHRTFRILPSPQSLPKKQVSDVPKDRKLATIHRIG
jgi:hypothetical protein